MMIIILAYIEHISGTTCLFLHLKFNDIGILREMTYANPLLRILLYKFMLTLYHVYKHNASIYYYNIVLM